MNRDRAETLALVAGGGVAGAVSRHGVALALESGPLPWGTLVVNLIGAFCLGVLLYEKRLRNALSPRVRLVAGTGFLSSFTTYSTFATEIATLTPLLAAAYVAATYGFGFLAVLAGRGAAGWLS